MKFFKDFKGKPWANATIAACLAVLFYVILTHLHLFLSALAAVYNWIRPIFLGLVIAYVLDPFAKIFERRMFKKLWKKNRNYARWIATALTIVIVLLLIAFLLAMLIPQLIGSISMFVSNFDSYSRSLQGFLQSANLGNILPISAEEVVAENADQMSQLMKLISSNLNTVMDLISDNSDTILGVTSSIGSRMVDAILAFIVAIYFLADKYHLQEVIKRILHHVLPDDKYGRYAGYWHRSNDIFIRFIAFDLVDGMIVGIVNCIFMLIMGIPYNVLISVIVGVTNLAPTFGPIVGGVLGGFILLLVNPWQALWFILFTIVLQTVDGYILKPKLFGGSLGVPAVWVLVTLIIGGRMFGVAGILLAIPFTGIFMFIGKEFFPYLFAKSSGDDS